MSNKARLQTNNESLNGYIARVNAAKDVAATLPEAGGREPVIEPLEVTENGTYTAPSGVDGYSPVTVNVPPITPSVKLQSKTVIPSIWHNVVTADEGYDGLSYVSVEPIPSQYIVPSGTKNITENGLHDVAQYETVAVNVPSEKPLLQEKTVTENGEVTPDAGYDGLGKVIVNVPTGGGGSNNYAKFIAKTDSSTSFIIENPLGGIAKKVSLKAIQPTTTSTRKIHFCAVDWDVKIGAVKAVNSSGSAVYSMNGTESTPNNGQFRMTDGFITVYRYNSANTWDTTCEYEIELFQ